LEQTVAMVPTERGSQLHNASGDLALELPAGFATTTPNVRVTVFQDSQDFQIGDGRTAVQPFNVVATVANTGAAVTQLDAPVGICTDFFWAEVERLDQNTLYPYWLDPLTGRWRTDGIAEVQRIRVATRP